MYLPFVRKIGMIILVLSLFLVSCKKNSDNQSQNQDIWDIDKDGIPKFVDVNYIELPKIYRISKYRSSVGHNYSDAFEQCRSMKHYFEPNSSVDWSSVKIYSPVTGKITRLEQEWAGTKVEIASDAYPAFRFTIFHINLSINLKIGDAITKGNLLGTHFGSQTYSDIAVIVNDPSRQGRMVSYFDVITDGIFNEYTNRGVTARTDLIIPKSIRDANPLQCNGDSFVGNDPLNSWVILQ
jgi:hypothetical protein